MELGGSFGMVCAFRLRSICPSSTTGWHFVSYTTLIDNNLTAGPTQNRDAQERCQST